MASRKIRGEFCEEIRKPKSAFDRRSFRWLRSGPAWLLIGCRRGKWKARGTEGNQCIVGTQVYKIMRPAGKRCPVHTKRVQK